MKRACSAIFLLLFAGVAGGVEEAKITVMSSAFRDGGAMPSKYALYNDNISPPISWSGLPEGTRSVAIICDDPDASRKAWTHWVIFNIPPDVGGLPEGVSDDAELPDGSFHGVNDFG